MSELKPTNHKAELLKFFLADAEGFPGLDGEQ